MKQHHVIVPNELWAKLVVLAAKETIKQKDELTTQAYVRQVLEEHCEEKMPKSL